MLTSNESYLLEQLLIKDDFQTYEYLASKLHVSVRTIQNLLINLSDYLEKNNLILEKKYGHGVRVVYKESKDQQALVNNLGSSLTYRREVMKLLLLFKFHKKTSINRMSKQLFLSKNSIMSDLRFIERELADYQLEIKRSHLGTEVIGSRKNVKAAIIDSIHRYGTNIIFDNHNLLTDEEEIASKVLTEEFKEIVSDGLDKLSFKFDYQFNPDFYETLVIQLIVDCLLFGEVIKSDLTDTSPTKNFFQKYLEKKLGIQFNKLYNNNRFLEYIQAFELVENSTDDYYELSRKLLKNYELIRNVDLIDSNLVAQINTQFSQLYLRKHYRIGVFHPFLNHIMTTYGAEFLALKLSIELLNELEFKIDDDEICFFLILIINSETIAKKKLIVDLDTEFSLSSSIYIKQLLEKEFPYYQFKLTCNNGLQADKQLTIVHDQDIVLENGSICSLDTLNPEHLILLKKELLQLERNNLENKRKKQFSFKFFEVNSIKKKSKYEVLEFLSDKNKEYKWFETEMWKEILLADRSNPLFWKEKKAALLIGESMNKNELIKIQLPIPIKWRINNEFSRVDTIYMWNGKKPKISDLQLIFKIIEFNYM